MSAKRRRSNNKRTQATSGTDNNDNDKTVTKKRKGNFGIRARTTKLFELLRDSGCRESLEEIRELLSKGIDCGPEQQHSASNRLQLTPIMAAVCRRRLDVVKLLVATNGAADLVAEANNGQCAVTFAAALCFGSDATSREIFKHLIERGGIDDVDRPVGRYGETAFMLLARDDTLDMLDYLVSRGADVNAVDMLGNNAMTHAFRSRHFSTLDGSVTSNTRSHATIEHLVSLGVDINHRNRRRETPLHVAALFDVAWAVEQLLECGANPTLLDQDGHTPRGKTSKQNRSMQRCLENAEREWNDRGNNGN